MFAEICLVFAVLGILQLTNASVPDECKGLNYCTVKPDDYPQELFNDMFRGKIKEPIFRPTLVLAEGRAIDPDYMNDCDTVVKFDTLYSVKTREGELKTVVQAPAVNFVQMVRLETCVKEGSSCFNDFTKPPGQNPTCKQKYNAWEFLVHDGKSGTERIKVDLPVCCSCYL